MVALPGYTMTHTIKEDLGSGISVEWLHDGAIVVYTIKLVTRQAVDTWMDKVLEVAQAWPLDKPYLVLHDVSAVALTPYARQRVLASSEAYPTALHGRYGLVIPTGEIGQQFMLFINRDYKPLDQRNMESRFFTSRRPAVAWLEEKLA